MAGAPSDYLQCIDGVSMVVNWDEAVMVYCCSYDHARDVVAGSMVTLRKWSRDLPSSW